MECTETSRRKNKILQEEKNSMIMGREKDTMMSDSAINIQLDTITIVKYKPTYKKINQIRELLKNR